MIRPFPAALLMAAALLLPQPARAAGPPVPLSTFDARAKGILARMTLDEKVGQMIQVERGNLVDEADIEKYALGSLLAGGNGDPKSNSLQDWTDMYDHVQSRALRSRLKIPL